MASQDSVRTGAAAASADVTSAVVAAIEAIKDHERRLDWSAEPWFHQASLRALPPVRELLDRSASDRATAVVLLTDSATNREGDTSDAGTSDAAFARALLGILAKRRVALAPDDAASILNRISTVPWRGSGSWIAAPVLPLLESSAEAWGDDERSRLAAVAGAAADRCEPAEALRLRALVPSSSGALPLHVIDRTQPVGVALVSYFEQLDEAPAAVARAIELFTALPSSGKPSRRWIADADAVRNATQAPGALVAGLLAAAEEPLRAARQTYLGEPTEHLLRGALRFAGTLEDPQLLGPLSVTARFMVSVSGPYSEPRSLKLANAAVVAISDLGLPGSITELQSLQRTIRHGALLNQITKSIDALAAAQGITTDQLLEQAVERHGLDADGTREAPLSRGVARITVTGRAATLTYVDEQGREKKSFPADVKDASDETLAELKDALKAIRKTIASERHRIDGLLGRMRTWPVDDWRRYYTDHPVTGRITRDLIWIFEPAGVDPGADGVPSPAALVGLPLDGQTVLLDDGTTAPIPDDVTVSLWHPVLATPTAVGAWRQHCLDHQLVQPVKQAFREIYVLTPAERETGAYSNRFAAHVFRQVQARALLKGRGWKTPPLAWWDDGRDFAVATTERDGLVVEFVYDPIEEIEPDGSDLFPLCTSDQVRFRRSDADEPMPLADVPAVAFSEGMRDVDLVIGVTSIGADPEWEDRGPDAIAERLRAYWGDYGFGELSAAGEVRHDVLATLLPSLAIADRCELEERFLKVRGDLRTYRIHLGSGNIQMEPNAEYLCIVPKGRSQASKLFLPLDDDPVLTVILSKALLLADDSSIDDVSILDQIKRR